MTGAVVVRAAVRGTPGADAVAAEAAALASIRHPHLAELAGAFELDGAVAVATRAVDGPTLAEVLEAGPLPWREVAAVLAPVARALAAVHDAGWVHGDVSAANVVVADAGGVLVDLGCARPAAVAGATGTPGSVAPEVVAGRPVTPAADVWALAAVAAEAVGATPPPDAALVLGRALAADPATRPTAGQFAAALALAAGEGPVAEPRARTTRDYGSRPPAPPASVPTHPRRAGPRAGVVVALVAVAVAVAVPATARSRARPAVAAPPPDGATWADGVLTVDLGAGPVRVAVGAAGDVVGLGDWNCDGRPTPAAFRPSTGTVTVWDAWPTEGPVAPSRVARSDGLPTPSCR